jgi:hypothetical protein
VSASRTVRLAHVRYKHGTFVTNTPTVLIGDLNSKHVAWNCGNTDTNGNILLDYCIARSITIHSPLSPTHFPTRGNHSVLDITLARGCSLTAPQSVTTLSSDHNPVVYKIRWNPTLETPHLQFDYNAAKWKQYQLLLDNLLQHTPKITVGQDSDRAIHYFTAAVKLAADKYIPKKGGTTRCVTLPPQLTALIKFRNHVRRKYQHTRYVTYRDGLQLLNRIIDTGLAHHRNGKWQSFLRSLNANNTRLWRVTRYFKLSREHIPPLLHQESQY